MLSTVDLMWQIPIELIKTVKTNCVVRNLKKKTYLKPSIQEMFDNVCVTF